MEKENPGTDPEERRSFVEKKYWENGRQIKPPWPGSIVCLLQIDCLGWTVLKENNRTGEMAESAIGSF